MLAFLVGLSAVICMVVVFTFLDQFLEIIMGTVFVCAFGYLIYQLGNIILKTWFGG
jgi:hypothetical protein